jgi:DNA-binding NarL/FixJ family response regulator
MAADGLTNREVGHKPYLAHRTVAYHLYRILPEFGIAVRKRLRDAFSGQAIA